MNRRQMLSAAGPAALVLSGAAAGAVQAAVPAVPRTFHATLDPEGMAALDRLLEMVKAQAEGRPIALPRDPDAELHALCATYHRQDGMSRDEGNPGWEAAADARHAAFIQIMPMVPITEAGHRAKAAVAVAEMDDNRCDGEWVGDMEALFALDTLKGWLGMPT